MEPTTSDAHVESKVPGQQKLREGDVDDTNDAIATKDDFTLSPVIIVTKQEAVFTKGDLKLQKVTVTEDISDSNTETCTTRQVYSSERGGEYVEAVSETSSQVTTTPDVNNGIDKENDDTNKTKTKIPTRRLRQTVERIKRQRIENEQKIKNKETEPQKPRKSSIPKLKEKSPTEQDAIKSEPTAEVNKVEITHKADDEFDKIFEEIFEKEVINNNVWDNTIDNAEKLESSFEEIIHAYEDNKIQPITVEVSKRSSKIPLLKRKSEQEIVVTEIEKKPLKKSMSVDSGKITESYFKEKVEANTTTKTTSVTTTNESLTTTSKLEVTKNEIQFSKQDITEDETKTVETFTKFSSNVDNETNIASREEKHTHESETTIEKGEKMHTSETEIISRKQILSSSESQLRTTALIREIQGNVKVAKPVFEKDINIEFKINDRVNDNKYKQMITKKKFETETAINKHENTENSKTVADLTNDSLKHETTAAEKLHLNQTFTTLDTKNVEIYDENYEIETKTSTNKNGNLENSKFAELRNKLMKLETSTAKKTEFNQRLTTDTKNVEVVSNITNSSVNSTDFKQSVLSVENITINQEELSANYKNIEQYDSKEKEEVKAEIEEDLSMLKGKVSEIINKLHNDETSSAKKEFADDIPIKTPIWSRIAIFENSKPKDSPKTKIPVFAQKAVNKESNKTEENILEKPTIVKEVLKGTIQIEINNNTEANQQKTTIVSESQSKLHSKLNVDKVEIANTEIQSTKIGAIEGNYSNTKYVKSIDENFTKTKKNIKTTDEVKLKNSLVNETFNLDVDLNEAPKEKPPPPPAEDIDEKEVMKKESYKRIYVDNKVIQDNKAILRDFEPITEKLIEDTKSNEIKEREKHPGIEERLSRLKSVDREKIKERVDFDVGEFMQGKVRRMVERVNSFERREVERKSVWNTKERPRKLSVLEKIALFEGKAPPTRTESIDFSTQKTERKMEQKKLTEEEYEKRIVELKNAKSYGTIEMKYLELKDGGEIPVIGLGTAMLDPRLIKHIVMAAIDMGYRVIDTAYIYGNEKEVGEAINEKIQDGSVKREDLFIISKLWSTFHRRDLVEKACRDSLDAMGLDYFDLYLIHNPMSFKEGGDPFPKIANVLQYSEHDYLEAWYGIEDVIRKGLVRRGGVSNFNSVQVERVMDKGKIKPVVNQVECHPYLSQGKLDELCSARGIKLSCFGTLGSKGTPAKYKNTTQAAIDDPLVVVMAAGLGVSPAQLLVSYQINLGRNAIVKASTAAHLWDNLRALTLQLDTSHITALTALNRNKRTFTFRGMGDTHKNYPFRIPF